MMMHWLGSLYFQKVVLYIEKKKLGVLSVLFLLLINWFRFWYFSQTRINFKRALNKKKTAPKYFSQVVASSPKKRT